LLIAFAVVSVLAGESRILQEFTTKSVPYVHELYQQVAKVNSGNFLVSPLSLQTVFALVNNGARGNTAKQITSSLCLPEEHKIKETFLQFTENLQTNNKYTLSSANKMYLKNNFEISAQFKKNAIDVFQSEIENIDLSNAQQAVTKINKWVEGKTHDKIKDLLKKEMITENTVAVLINALYFQGKWVKEFGDVSKGEFWLNNRKSVVTEMMGMSDDFNYYRSKELNAKFLEMPYKGNDVTMTFVLPLAPEGISALEARIADVLVAPKYELHRMDILIPKFKIETTTSFIPILKAMGITDAFIDGVADFTGVGERHEQLSISEVVQKTFIEVDEKGTTAAAASAVNLGDRSFNEYEFAADHPFIFYLKHRTNGILFIGKFAMPDTV